MNIKDVQLNIKDVQRILSILFLTSYFKQELGGTTESAKRLAKKIVDIIEN